MRGGLVYIVVFAVVLVSAALIFAVDAPDEVVLDKVRDKLPPVRFKHKKHVEEIKVECKTCHHKTPDNPSSCYSCHKKDKDGDVIKAKDSFHKLCAACHKEKKGGELCPPVKCKECHVKEAPKEESEDSPEGAPEETPK